MLLPTVLIIAVNLALGFVAAVGRERWLALRAGVAAGDAEISPPDDAASPASATDESPADQHVAEDAANSEDNTPEPAATSAATPTAAEPPTPRLADEVVGNSEAGGIADDVLPTANVSSDADAPESLAAATAVADESDSSDAAATDDGQAASSLDAITDDAPVAPQEVAVAAAAESASEELPQQWFDLLKDIEKEGYGKCRSFVEASTQVLRLEVGRYRGELVQLDRRIRALFDDAFDADALAAALAEVQAVNQDWLERQGEAVGHLVSRRENLGELQAAGERLEAVLMDQTAQIETSCSNIRQFDFGADREGAERRLLVEICRLIDMAHVLRDQLQETLLAIVVGEGRVATLDRRRHVDALSGFVNRTGLEAVLYEWWRDDANRIRQLSLAMFDVARLGRFNERHGVAVGDGMLAAVGKIVDGALRKKRGCDLVARCSGQRFVIVLGDTGPRNATSAAEHIRQMIAASTFEVDAQPCEVVVSCGVVEASHEDDAKSALGRLDACVALAKKLGRNTTCLDEGKGPAAVDNPPRYEARGTVVRLERA